MNFGSCNRRRLLALFVSFSAAVMLVIVNGQKTIEVADDNTDNSEISELISIVDELRARVASLERQLSASTANKPEHIRRRPTCKFNNALHGRLSPSGTLYASPHPLSNPSYPTLNF